VFHLGKEFLFDRKKVMQVGTTSSRTAK